MARFVLSARPGVARRGDLERIGDLPGVTVLDRVDERAALIEAPHSLLAELRELLPGWLIAEERVHPRPELPGKKR